jgi:hypothetical protein
MDSSRMIGNVLRSLDLRRPVFSRAQPVHPISREQSVPPVHCFQAPILSSKSGRRQVRIIPPVIRTHHGVTRIADGQGQSVGEQWLQSRRTVVG